MKGNKVVIVAILALVLLIPASTAFAGSVSSSGMTLSWPDYPLTGPALYSCEPWYEPTANTVTISGIPAGSSVRVIFAWANPYSGAPNYRPAQTFSGVGGTLVIPVDYPMDTTTWPVYNTTTNERAISVAVSVHVTRPDGTVVKLIGKQWWIRCLPPPPPAEGCTPGYWRQDHHFDSWVPTGYAPSDDFEVVFGVNASFNPHAMSDAVWLGGGGENALARHAVAALLNAAHPDVDYVYTVAEVIAMTQSAYSSGDFEPIKDLFDVANNAGCTLN